MCLSLPAIKYRENCEFRRFGSSGKNNRSPLEKAVESKIDFDFEVT